MSNSPEPARPVEPAKVRLYGLIPITRRRYLVQLAAGVVLAAVLLGLRFAFHGPVRADILKIETPARQWLAWAWEVSPWVVLAVAAGQAVEAAVVLRAFARKH